MNIVYTNYPEIWKSMLDDCKSAKSFIYIEQFIWRDFNNGEIGREFLDLLKEKVQEGVEVRMIIDAVGSLGLTSNAWRQDEITNGGIKLFFFRTVPKWKSVFPFNMFHRDHRKIIVIDDQIAHVGGAIISEGARGWCDFNIRTRDKIYVKELKGAILRMLDDINQTKEHKNEYDSNTEIILKNDPESNDIYEELLKRIHTAQKRITIVTPYLSPNRKILRALKKACRRGVIVEILLPKECDSVLTGMVNLSYFRQLSKSKMNIYLYPICMNHGKLVIIDDWITVGSANFDRLSFFYNRELNIVLPKKDNPAINDLVKRYVSQSILVDKKYIKNFSFITKIKSLVGKILRPIA